MENNIRKSVKLAYWLVLIVLLLFEHPAAVALTVGSVSYENHGEDDDQIDFPETCSDWEEFDGIECVCASTSVGCRDDCGMVCDEQGIQYRSSCFFALQMCQQNISIDDKIVSCGACNTLRLTGGKKYPKGITLAKFLRQGPDAGLSTRYKSINDNETEIFFVPALNAWAIGKPSTNGTFISMVQPTNASFPGDGIPGMLIPNKNGTDITWEFDESFRLECVEGQVPGVRVKRFIFTLIFAAIFIVTTAVTTTLKIVQATRGCLYYPSVCKMRDEIKDLLLPSLKRDKERFLSSYGEPKEFEAVVVKIHNQIQTIQEKIIEIPDLHTTLNISLSSLVQTYSSMRHDYLRITYWLSDYDEWLSGVLEAAIQDTTMLPLNILMTLPSLVAASASSMALAMSGIGAVVSFAFGIVDIVSSVLQEKKIIILEVKEAKAFLDVINMKVKEQRRRPGSIFRFIKNNKPRKTKEMFGNLFEFLKFISKSVIPTNKCYWGQNLDHIRSGLTTGRTYTNVPVCKSNEISYMINVINTAVHNQDTICKIHRQVQGSVFRNKFQTVRFIADNVLPTQHCYWGYDLDDIRATPNSTEVSNANVDSGLLSILHNLESVGQIDLARNVMEGMFSIHSTKWQNFLLCHVWKNQAAMSNLHCSSFIASPGCIPTVSSFQSC
ncbi:unnamed protein product [Mytilus edulis]|uniref:Uncharacterized protein n=1 Tax=Mytilus edulis TaxID=6550 RepID=A0A8S3TCR0_MYTED|nr:unnamed protein product [Mytilus edulis]